VTPAELRQAISDVPTLMLAPLPTPVEPMTGLAAMLGGGPKLFVKRDDTLGFAFGGNKVRKLERLLPQARARGKGRILTVGTAGSNHVLATVEIALNARAADGSSLYDFSIREEGITALRQLLIHFQGTGEFRADFDPDVMAMAIRAALDAVPARLARDPGLDIGRYGRELADLFQAAVRPAESQPGTVPPVK